MNQTNQLNKTVMLKRSSDVSKSAGIAEYNVLAIVCEYEHEYECTVAKQQQQQQQCHLNPSKRASDFKTIDFGTGQ